MYKGMSTDSLANALEQDHIEVDAVLAAYADAHGDQLALERAIPALRRHIYLEEEFLFPRVRETEPDLARAITVMVREHAQIWDDLNSLEREQNADAKRAICGQLANYLLNHNTKEEQLVYSRVDEVLPPAESEKLRVFLGSGEMPEGWVCEWARS